MLNMFQSLGIFSYFTNKLNCLHICNNACSRQEFFTAFSIDLVDLVNISQTNFILAQKFVSFILSTEKAVQLNTEESNKKDSPLDFLHNLKLLIQRQF